MVGVRVGASGLQRRQRWGVQLMQTDGHLSLMHLTGIALARAGGQILPCVALALPTIGLFNSERFHA